MAVDAGPAELACDLEHPVPLPVINSHNGSASTRLAVGIWAVAALVLVVLIGTLGVRARATGEFERQRGQFLDVGRQAALDLTTIEHTTADADVARILSSATGLFHEDFEKRAQPLVEVVKQTQSKSVGVIADSGVETFDGHTAQVLVAVQVTTTAGGGEQPDHGWRMRIRVEKVGDLLKVSNVQFIA